MHVLSVLDPFVAKGYTAFHNAGAVRPEFAVVSAFWRTREVRLPPSRAKRASASLAEAFGKGGKPDTTYYKHMKTAVARQAASSVGWQPCDELLPKPRS